MSAPREEILARIRAAVGPTRSPADIDAAYAALPRTYRRAHHDSTETDIVALFAERAADYRAVVERVSETDLPAAIARVLAGLSRFVVPDGLPPQWLATGDKLVRDDPPLSARQLDAVAVDQQHRHPGVGQGRKHP